MKLNVQEARDLLAALKALNGATRVITEEGKPDREVQEPYDFSGDVLWNIAKNLRLLGGLDADFIDAKNNLIRAISGCEQLDTANQVQMERWTKEITAILEREEDLPVLTLSRAGLKTDKNRIPPGIIAALIPYISEP